MTVKINPELTLSEALSKSWKKRATYKGYDKSKGSSFNSWRAIIYSAKGRAIGFPEEWKNYSIFMNDVQGEWLQGKIARRLDIKNPHSKDNTYWADKGTEATGKLIRIVYNGEEKTLLEWAEKFNINYQGIRQRYFKGKNLTPHEIIFGKTKKIKSHFNKNKENRLVPMLGAYKLRDKKKNRTCDIELNWLREFVASGCHYCGAC